MADQSIVLTPATFARLEKVLEYVEGMMKAAIPNGSNGPRGPVFPPGGISKITHIHHDGEEPLHFGKIQNVAPCNAYCNVYECNEAGDDVFGTQLVVVAPTKGGCEITDNRFCLNVGDVIAFLYNPEDPTEGFQVGASKRISMGYQCGEAEGGPTNLAHVDDISRIEPYLTDFYIGPSSTCSGPTNLAQLNWRGCIVVGYNTICGGTNTAGTGGVKVLDFDNLGIPGRDSYNTNHARIAFDVSCATTSANVPTLGGSPCLDNSLPVAAKIIGHLPTDAFIKEITGATGICNTNTGGITITITYVTARAAVPF